MRATDHDLMFMQRAIELAQLGAGHVSPNPLVGCVIVHHNEIIGEGWHKQYGGPHAEVNAVNAVADKSKLKSSTVYVTLEPCSHFGKTPPCADLLIRESVSEVVIANVDPNPLVSGSGIKKLKDAGIKVRVGVLEAEAAIMNRRFLTFFRKQRPYIILKWAQTSDGFVARENFDSKWISDGFSRQLVHKWRTEEDAILVGTNTARYDNPQLNVRDWSGRNPVRVVIDRELTLPADLNLFDHSQPTFCYNTKQDLVSDNLTFVRADAEILFVFLLRDLYQRKIQSVIVEGGATILNEFISKNCWDEARVFTSPLQFERGITAPMLTTEPATKEQLRADLLSYYYNA